MITVPITVTETAGIDRHQEPFTIGIPLSQGLLFGSQNCATINNGKESMPVDIHATAYWPDGSAKWIIANAQISLTSNASTDATINIETKTPHLSQGITIEETPGGIIINTGESRLIIPKDQIFALPLHSDLEPTSIVKHLTVLTDNDGCNYLPVISEISLPDTYNTQACIIIRGTFTNEDNIHLVNFESKLTFFVNHSIVSWELTIHNPRKAKHTGGLWDLGDDGSIFFSKLHSQLSTKSTGTIRWKSRPEEDWHKTSNQQPLHLFQASSGGENWNSRNHVNKQGVTPLLFKGFQCKENEVIILEGERAQPEIEFIHPEIHISGTIENFWQNFPKSLSANQNSFTLGWFPDEHKDDYELQGGEKKTHQAFINFSSNETDLNWTNFRLKPRIPLSFYQDASAMPHLTDLSDDRMTSLINQGIQGSESFFQKRERIDEFSWRNFGEIFADHETLYQAPSEPLLISHYNNQYDPIMGFARQYMRSGDTRWFTLMDDLAKHIVDIDIYHTTEDRDEYNNGLFWHTDHYLDSHTCTHRTFTRHNTTSSTPGQTGGGPGSEHCYSTGLLYHYYLTGNEQSKMAVERLAHWMINIHEGGNSFLGRLNKLVQRQKNQLKIALNKNATTSYRYPLTRGTGNYIVALLDAHQSSGDSAYLRQVENIIKNTLNPNDDITQRNLKDTEVAWSYTILLLSLEKYLYRKEQLNEIDSDHDFAKTAFLHYAEWMLNNETFFLANEDILEYPNHTWVAQEIRKACIFNIAATLDISKKDIYTNKACEFMEYIYTTLETSPEKGYSRIQIILLQNHGLHSPAKKPRTVSHKTYQHPAVPTTNLWRVATSTAAQLFSAAKHFSWKNEKRWVSTRFAK